MCSRAGTGKCGSHGCSERNAMRGKRKFRVEYAFSGKRIYLIYSVVFIMMCAVIFRFFYRNGRSFVCTVDGWTQHFKALIYYAEWLRSAVRELFAGHFQLPTFSFSLGYGSDILTTLHYYAIGDPLNLFSVFVPADAMVYFYEFLILLRLYLSGVCFMGFCLYMRRTGAADAAGGAQHKNRKRRAAESLHGNESVARKQEDSAGSGSMGRMGVLAGAFTYVFCGYALFAAMRHPYFINPMICLPLVLLGVEKLLREKKPVCLILSVFLSAVSNFYFFYAIALLTVLYVCFRLVVLRAAQKECRGLCSWKKPLLDLLQIAGCSFAGVLLSAVVLLPVILMFLGDARSGSGNEYDFFYQRDYYKKFLPSFFSFRSMGNWTIMCYSAAALPSVILLFLQRKRNTALKAGFLLLTAFLLFPVFGHIFNGFSYVSNRWIWGYGMLTAYIAAVMWEKLFSMTKKEILLLAAVYVCCAAVCLNLLRQFESRRYAFFQLAVGAAVSAVFAVVSAVRAARASGKASAVLGRLSGWTARLAKLPFLLPEMLVFCLVLCSIARNARHFYAEDEENYPAKFVLQKSVNPRLAADERRALAPLADGSFWRYTGPAVTRNATLLNGLSSTQFYWSLANGAIAEFFKSLGVPEPLPYDCRGLDDRTILNTLLGVRYYTALVSELEEASVPYGFERVSLADKSAAKKYAVYENRYALPLGYTYSGYLLRENYEKLPAAARQEAMLQAAVTDEPFKDFAEVEPRITAERLPYQMSFSSKNVSLQGDSFVVTKKGAYATLHFEGREACEICFLLTGLSFEGVSPYRLYNDDRSIDPYDLFTQKDWEELSDEEQKKKTEADRDYREQTKIDLSLELTLEDGSKISKVIPYRTPRYTWYNDVHDFQMNLGYHEQGSVSLKIRFPYIGIYRFEELGIFAQPLELYREAVQERGEAVLEDLDLHRDNGACATGLVTGKISLDEPQILCLTIPYSAGWTAFVDGEEQPLRKVNLMSMALPLSEGEHDIRLEYRTPGLTAGWGLSLAGLAVLAGAVLYQRRKNRGAGGRVRSGKRAGGACRSGEGK